jgi:hypothetical protein
MVKINFNIQKKDLWLLSAIMVFLIGVGYVVAYNPSGAGGIPSTMGHSVDEMDWSKPIPSNLYVNGQVTITGGSPGASKVLTSDASGLASWGTTSAYLGLTTATFNGNLGGYVGAATKCSVNYPNSHLCGCQEVHSLPGPTSSTYGYCGGSLNYNCLGFTDAGGGGGNFGAKASRTSGEEVADCYNDILRLHCCR